MRFLTSPIMKELLLGESLREPSLHEERAMTSEALQVFLNANKGNVESAMMTVAGPLLENGNSECTHCQQLNRTWARCTMIEGEAGNCLTCNNYHRLRRGNKCEKYVPRDNADVLRGRRRPAQRPRAQSPSPAEDRKIYTTNKSNLRNKVESQRFSTICVRDIMQYCDIFFYSVQISSTWCALHGNS